MVDLVSPSDNVFGFEYEPTTDEDVTFAADQIALLTSADLLAFNEEAGCAVTDVQTAQEFDGSHAEVTASWTFLCENADSVTQLDLSAVFEAFPGFVEIDAAWASEETQSAAELTPSASIVRFG